MGVRAIATAALCGTTTLFGCTLFLNADRSADVESGGIAGRVIRSDTNAPAEFSKLELLGTGFGRRADGGGSFSFTGLKSGTWVLRVDDDDNGDGKAERTALQPVMVVATTVPSGVIGESATRETAGILVGDVIADGTGTIKGTVTGAPDGTVARVMAFRTLDVPFETTETLNIADDDSNHFDWETFFLGAEAEDAADATGKFVLVEVGTSRKVDGARTGTKGGEIATYVVGALYSLEANGELGALLEVTRPQKVELAAGQTLEGTSGVTLAFVDPTGGSLEETEVGVRVAPALASEFVYATLVRPGAEQPPCQVGSVPDFTGTVFDGVRVLEPSLPAARGREAVQFTVPWGRWDMQLCTDVGGLPFRARLFRQIVTELPEGVQIMPLGPTLFQDPGQIECGVVINGTVQRDCDGDNLPGLPPLDDAESGSDDVAAWDACEAQCGRGATAAVASATCSFEGTTFDCDDDADGQADPGERVAANGLYSTPCYGPGNGSDLDGDGLCSGNDGFPDCAENTPEACNAEAEPDVVDDPPGGGGSGTPNVQRDAGVDIGTDAGGGGSAGNGDAGSFAPQTDAGTVGVDLDSACLSGAYEICENADASACNVDEAMRCLVDDPVNAPSAQHCGCAPSTCPTGIYVWNAAAEATDVSADIDAIMNMDPAPACFIGPGLVVSGNSASASVRWQGPQHLISSTAEAPTLWFQTIQGMDQLDLSDLVSVGSLSITNSSISTVIYPTSLDAISDGLSVSGNTALCWADAQDYADRAQMVSGLGTVLPGQKSYFIVDNGCGSVCLSSSAPEASSPDCSEFPDAFTLQLCDASNVCVDSGM